MIVTKAIKRSAARFQLDILNGPGGSITVERHRVNVESLTNQFSVTHLVATHSDQQCHQFGRIIETRDLRYEPVPLVNLLIFIIDFTTVKKHI